MGYMYIGTALGIDRFDGTNVVNITCPGTDGQCLSWVRAIVDDGHGGLLLGTDRGLFRLDKRTFTFTRLFGKQLYFRVNALVRDAEGDIYLGTDRGLLRMASNTSDRLENLNISNRHTTDMAVYSIALSRTHGSSGVWLALRHGVLRYAPKGRSVFYPCAEGSNVILRKVAVCPDGQVFAGTAKQGVLRLDKTVLKPFALSRYEINDLRCWKGSLLVATELYGAFELNSRTGRVVHTYNSYGSSHRTAVRFDSPRVFFRDDLGVNWLGYAFFGVDYTYYTRNIFHLFAIPGLFYSSDYQVRNFLFDGSRVLLCTRRGLIVADRSGGVVRVLDPELLGSPLVTNIIKYGGRYYVALVGGGVKVIDAVSLMPVTEPAFAPLAGLSVYDIVNDGRGSLWFTSSAGLLRYRPDTGAGRLYTAQNSQLPDNEVFCFGVDASGLGWISTRGGICTIYPETGEISSRNLPQAITALGDLNSIVNDGDNTYFIPQAGFPLVYNALTRQMRQMTFPALTPSISSYYLHHVGRGSYVFASENGLFLGHGDSLRQFGLLDGLPATTMQSRNMRVDRNGMFWTATNDGLAYARLSDMLRNDHPHIPIVLTDVQTGHWWQPEEVNEANEKAHIKLSRSGNDLSLKFTPLLYANKRGIRYRYRLEGYDDWHLAGYDNVIFYHDLPPGSYNLHIEAFGMPEISTVFKISSYIQYETLVILIAILFVLAFMVHVLYCKIKKVPYFWDRFLPKSEKYHKSKVRQEQGEHIMKALLDYMDKEKPYLNPELQMSDVAGAIGCTTHVLSQVFSLYLRRSYYDFIAEYRVREFQRLAHDPKYSKYTITALSQLCGFRSRTPFLTAFKKFVGISPKEFMKTLK